MKALKDLVVCNKMKVTTACALKHLTSVVWNEFGWSLFALLFLVDSLLSGQLRMGVGKGTLEWKVKTLTFQLSRLAAEKNWFWPVKMEFMERSKARAYIFPATTLQIPALWSTRAGEVSDSDP